MPLLEGGHGVEVPEERGGGVAEGGVAPDFVFKLSHGQSAAVPRGEGHAERGLADVEGNVERAAGLKHTGDFRDGAPFIWLMFDDGEAADRIGAGIGER